MLGFTLPAHAAGTPAAPQHLAYKPGSLIWNAVPGVEYYLVGQAATRSGPFHSLSARHLAPNAALPLALSTRYYFVVYAVTRDGRRKASNPLGVFLKPVKQLKRPGASLFPNSYFRARKLWRHRK